MQKKEESLKVVEDIDVYYPTIKKKEFDGSKNKTSRSLLFTTLCRICRNGVYYDIPVEQEYLFNERILKNFDAFQSAFYYKCYITIVSYIVDPEKEILSPSLINEATRIEKFIFDRKHLLDYDKKQMDQSNDDFCVSLKENEDLWGIKFPEDAISSHGIYFMDMSKIKSVSFGKDGFIKFKKND